MMPLHLDSLMSSQNKTPNSWYLTFKEESSFIREYFWKYRRLVFWGLLALLTVDVLEILPPLILKHVVDTIGQANPEQNLIYAAGAYLAVTFLQALGRFGWRFFLVRTSIYSGRDLRDRYADHLFKLSPSFYDKKKIGDLMSLATSDVEAVRTAMGGGLIIFADAVIYLLTVPLAMFYLSPKLTLITFIPLLVAPFFVIRNERKIHERFTKVQESFSRLAVLAQENLMGIRVVKGFAREDAQIKRFTDAGKEYLRLNLDLARVQSAFGPVLDFIMSLGLILLLYLGGAQTIDNALTIGTFIAFQRYVQKMIWPMTAVGLSITFYQRAVAGSNRLKEVFAQSTDTPENPHPQLPKIKTKTPQGKWRTSGQIEIRNLSFTYPNSSYPGSDKQVLKNISMTIESGSRVAIVGSIGSGKTSLLSLLPRLYPAPAGTLFVDGVDVNNWKLSDLRDQIGFVGQDTFLFSETVFENVSLGLFEWVEQDRESAVMDATHRAAVHPEILKLDKTYKTEIGERGVNVSGGQKQRLTIARALAKEPPILILDDALSAVDMETESKILAGLKNRSNRNTEILSAHRISTVKDADHIYVLDKGSIVQSGTHSSLLKEKGGIYWRFYEQQRLEQELQNYVKDLQS